MRVLDLDDGEDVTYTINDDAVGLAPADLSSIDVCPKPHPLTGHIIAVVNASKMGVDFLFVVDPKPSPSPHL